jgi:hypothetical protein
VIETELVRRRARRAAARDGVVERDARRARDGFLVDGEVDDDAMGWAPRVGDLLEAPDERGHWAIDADERADWALGTGERREWGLDTDAQADWPSDARGFGDWQTGAPRLGDWETDDEDGEPVGVAAPERGRGQRSAATSDRKASRRPLMGKGGARRRGDIGVPPRHRLLSRLRRAAPPAALEWRDAQVPLLGRLWANFWLPSVLLAGLLVAMVYLLQTSGVATTGYDIQSLQMQRDDWQLRNEQLQFELSKRRSLTWIESEATGRLGMVRPEPTALTYVKVPH